MKSESTETDIDHHGGAAEADGVLAAMEASEAAEGTTEDAAPATGAYLKGLIEAVLFVSDHPLELKDVARAARIDRARTQELLDELAKDYQERGIRLELVAGGYAFRSSPEFADRVRQYLSLRPVRLSRAQLETLAIVAYRQPITRPEIDDVRGVDSGPVLKGLLERDLIRIIGKKDEPGRPMLYGTTGGFLEAFSLKSLRDLPTLREYTELSEESRRVFESELGETAPEGPLTDEASAEGANGQAEGSTTIESTIESTSAPEGSASGGDADKDEDGDDEDGDDEDGDDEDGDDEDGDDEDDDEDDDDEDDDDEDDDDDDDDDDDEDDDEDEDEAGKDKVVKDKAAKDKPGKDKPGKDKPGKDKPGKDKAGKDKAGKK
jgi:segregation and condensation protein B